jgi:pyrimidine-nucleoside phosphorylase
MNTYDLIFKKREGLSLTTAEINYMISGFLNGEVPPYQMSAFLMAVFFKGMSAEELHEFTKIMVESGQQLNLDDIPEIAVDKHSTGGVGDGVSITLAPLVASFGIVVPMMSGRSLGHTGGTLDKLEAIPGFRVDLTDEEFKKQLSKIGVAMIGQTENIAPADKKMYALRDVTATVDNIELISASIMCKKIAEGANGLVLDVKTGSGAFMRKYDDAVKLAKSMISIGKFYNRKMAAVISDMNQPLGKMIGNGLEIKQAIELMKGEGPEDIKEIIVELAARMLLMGEKAEGIEEAKSLAVENLKNGKALEKFKLMVQSQGGDPRVCEDPDSILAPGKYEYDIENPQEGFIKEMDTRRIGMCALSLGAGRERVGEEIDFSAGIEVNKKIGDRVGKGEVVARLYSSKVADLAIPADEYLKSLNVSNEKVEAPKLIYEVINEA